MLLKNGLVLNRKFEFINADVLIQDKKIAAVREGICSENDEVIELNGKLVLPGFINIHVHGAVGYDMMNPGEGGLAAVSRFMALHGATSFMPTTVTLPLDDTLTAMSYLAEHSDADYNGANILGIHSEGIYMSEVYRGAHVAQWLKPPSEVNFEILNEAAGGKIKLVTVAPELDGALEMIRRITPDVRVSLGHGGQDYRVCKRAFEAGASQITHMFNAMPPLHHRNPTLIAAAFEADAFVELICDGIHVNPVMVKMAYSMFGADRIVVITDGMPATGLGAGKYFFAGEEVIVSGGTALKRDGTINGSTSTMMQCVINLVNWGIPVESAVKMAARNPAHAVSVQDRKGCIDVGFDADLLVTDADLNIENVIVMGKGIINNYENSGKQL